MRSGRRIFTQSPSVPITSTCVPLGSWVNAVLSSPAPVRTFSFPPFVVTVPVWVVSSVPLVVIWMPSSVAVMFTLEPNREESRSAASLPVKLLLLSSSVLPADAVSVLE